MASAAFVTEKPNNHQTQQQQQQQVLKCPRCHSSNTKFCYYNNYSLSQPRHFCKACKRYWTRGGTLRNVPVGGGCRKNKRIKKTFTSVLTPRVAVHNPNPNYKPNLDENPSYTPSKNNSNHHINPLFHGLLPQNPKYPRFVSRVSSVSETDVSRYGLLQPHMNTPGLGFSSSYTGVHNSNSVFSSCPTMFSGGSSSSCTSDSTMASLLASSLQEQPRFLGFAPYEDGDGSVLKDVQLGGRQYRMDWNNSFHGQSDNDRIKGVESSDPNSFSWTTAVGDGGDWLDPTSNTGSSVPSLI